MENIDNAIKVEEAVEITEIASTEKEAAVKEKDYIEKAKSAKPSKKSASKGNDSVERMLSDITKAIGVSEYASLESVAEEIKLDERIACISMTFGGLTWVSPKTHYHYRWNNYGSVVYLTFDELITMNNSGREFMFRPLIFIQDPRVVSYFGLVDIYNEVRFINQLENISKKDSKEISALLDKIKKANMRDVAISKIRQMRQNGALNNIDVIQVIEKNLHYDIASISPGR